MKVQAKERTNEANPDARWIVFGQVNPAGLVNETHAARYADFGGWIKGYVGAVGATVAMYCVLIL
jgi:hypothetical protein